MNSEAAILVGLLRAGMTLLISFGVFLTSEQQDAIIVFAGAAIAGIGLAMSLITRFNVFSKDTVEVLVAEAAASGSAEVGSPPSGNA